MREKKFGNPTKPFAWAGILSSAVLLWMFLWTGSLTVAASTVSGQDGGFDWNDPKQNSVQITSDSLVGRYGFNYTGNVNWKTTWVVGEADGEPGGYSENEVYNDLNFPQYVNFSDYEAGVTQHYTPNRYGQSQIQSFNSSQIQPNSSTAVLEKTKDDARIKEAYLIWYTRDSARLFGYAHDPVYFRLPNGRAEWLEPEKACIDRRWGWDSLLCLSADVTDLVRQAGYGTYGVANIPYWYQTTKHGGGRTAGSCFGGWQLVVIEESADYPVRKVDLNIGSTFADKGYTGTLALKNGLKTRPSGDASGEVFFTGFLGSEEQTSGNVNSIYNTVYSDTMPSPLKGGMIKAGEFVSRGKKVNSHGSGSFAYLETFPHVGNNATQITTQSGGHTSWDTYFCLGIAADIAFPVLDGQQKTAVNGDNSKVTVTGGYTNITTDSDTGIGGGALTVTLDNELTPSESVLTVTYADGGSKTVHGTYDIVTHTVRFDGVDLLRKGDGCSYKITCDITSTVDERFFNSDALSGYLYSNGVALTGYPVEKASSSESWLYLVVEILLNTQGTAIDGGTVSSSGTEKYYEYYNVGNFADREHKTPIDRITVPVKRGCQFMGYYTGMNGTGTQYVTADGKITSTATTFTDDTVLYAYWTPGVYAVTDADTGRTLFYEKYTVGFFKNRVLHANGVTYEATGAVSAVSDVPQKRGHTYAGYFTRPDGKGTQYVLTNRSICMANNWIVQDTLVYAKWEPVTYRITLNHQGADSAGSQYFNELYGVSFYYDKIVLTGGNRTVNYGYTGGTQYYIAPYTGTYYLNVLGAQGSSSYGTGGLGARTYGCVSLVQGEILRVNVGGAGSGQYGAGWNGGSAGGSFHWTGGAGGGATDIRRNGAELGNRIIVAGGGGGGVAAPQNYISANGGNGGGTSWQPLSMLLHGGAGDKGNPSNPYDYRGPYPAGYEGRYPKYADPQSGTANGKGGGGGYYGGRAYGVPGNITGTAVIPAGEGGTSYYSGLSGGTVGGNYYGVGDIPGQQWGNGYASVTQSNYTTKYSTTEKIDRPTRIGYTFFGYYEQPDGGGSMIVDANGNILVPADYFNADTTLYAKWVAGDVTPPATYVVRFHGNGATDGYMQPMVCNVGQTYRLRPNAYSKRDYVFDGWSTYANGPLRFTDEQFFHQGTLGMSAGGQITLYARWKDAIPPVIKDETTDGTDINHSYNEIEYDWVNHRVNLKFSATDNAAMKSLTLYGPGNRNHVLASGKDRVNYTVTQEGRTEYWVVAEDQAGNTATTHVIVKIDYHAPDGEKEASYDGMNLTVSLRNIKEELSGCKKIWIKTTAFLGDGTAIRTDERELAHTTPGNIHNGAAYTGTFVLEDEYNYASSYMEVEVWARDIAGNEQKVGSTEHIETFYLNGYVERALGPAEYWKAGEAGYVHLVTGVYVDRVEIIYPDKWTKLDETLGTHTYDYAGNKEVEKTESDLFYIPLRAENNAYEITVVATKNGYTKTVTLPVATDGNIISSIKHRLRYSPDDYPLFKD